MKLVRIFSAVLILAACGQSGTQEAIMNDIGYPPEAVIQPYDGLPGREKVTVFTGDQIIAEGDYLNGQPDGIWAEYDANSGMPLSVANYLNGQLHGVSLTFDDRRGELVTRAFYNKGVLEGQFLTFDRRKKVEERNYIGGVLNGMVRKFYRSGNVLEEAPYENGVLHGTAKWYDEEGNLTIQYEYENGDFIADTTPEKQDG